jgi:hypothetical protein
LIPHGLKYRENYEIAHKKVLTFDVHTVMTEECCLVERYKKNLDKPTATIFKVVGVVKMAAVVSSQILVPF